MPDKSYPEGVTEMDHVNHDMKMGRFPNQSSVETFLKERAMLAAQESVAHLPSVQAERDGDDANLRDEIETAIWKALAPFRSELVTTGGVTFMGLRNAVANAIAPFIEQHRSDAREWHVEYKQTRSEKNEIVAENIQLRNALKEEAHWHDRKAKELGKQPPSHDRNWRMGVHRERRDAICPLVGWPEGGAAWHDSERQA